MMSNKKVSVNVNSSINQFGSLQNADQVLAEFGKF
ncbi:unnamed protein product [Brugia timori]|uniref:RRM domain-containing protein n=1 Tax=Brugia timori TaxID=42155 RepID=A0A0R3RDM2_9BILA|nr:unnamed protein product [Brugia timori]